jgi:hypothetical protein
MTLRYVAPTYEVIAPPRTPWEGDAPYEVEQAFDSVIMFTHDRREEDWGNLEIFEYLSAKFNPEGAKAAVMSNVAPRVIYLLPELKYKECVAYICPILSAGGEGYLVGYVVARKKKDAFTVAKYLAGGA